MPRVVTSITEVPFTFYFPLRRDQIQGTEPDPVLNSLPFEFMKNSYWDYAYNMIVIGNAVTGSVPVIMGPPIGIIEGDVSDVHSLGEAFPNPAKDEITFRFSLVQPAHTTLTITNAIGQTVATVIDEFIEGGREYSTRFNTSRLPIGTYYYTLTSGPRIETKMFTVVR